VKIGQKYIVTADFQTDMWAQGCVTFKQWDVEELKDEFLSIKDEIGIITEEVKYTASMTFVVTWFPHKDVTMCFDIGPRDPDKVTFIPIINSVAIWSNLNAI
jgi:hypothetical protein